MNFGNDIKKLREEAGMTQQELADRAGVSRSYIARLETTNKKGTVDTLRKIFNVFDLDLEIKIVKKTSSRSIELAVFLLYKKKIN